MGGGGGGGACSLHGMAPMHGPLARVHTFLVTGLGSTDDPPALSPGAEAASRARLRPSGACSTPSAPASPDQVGMLGTSKCWVTQGPYLHWVQVAEGLLAAAAPRLSVQPSGPQHQLQHCAHSA